MMLILLVAVLAHSDPVGSSKHPQAVAGLAVSPDRHQFASLSSDGMILIWDLKSGREVRRCRASGQAAALAWPRPDRLIIAGARAVDVIDPATGKSTARHAVGQRTDAAVVAPDGRFAVVANTHFTGRLIDVATGQRLRPFPAPAESTYALDVSPDGAFLALTSCGPDPESITLLETRGFTTVRRWPTGLKDTAGLRFSPDGTRLAAVGDGDRVQLWNAGDGTEAKSLQTARPRAAALAFSPDGRRLAVGCGVPAGQFLPGHPGLNPPDRPTATPGAYPLQCWDLTTGTEVWSTTAPTAWATAMRFLPDGRLVTGHADGTVRFWNLPE